MVAGSVASMGNRSGINLLQGRGGKPAKYNTPALCDSEPCSKGHDEKGRYPQYTRNAREKGEYIL